ncbi:hypothetical protein MMC18_006680 [Xylographa bjoerkii]|nr:hypothetical protein [Xylographa bjoerkii]
MRRSVLIFLVINLLVIAFLVRSVFTLITLLTETGDADAITRGEIPAPQSPSIDSRPQLIPKIIHQTYINETIPERWREPVQQCLEMHEDYEYQLWTDASSRDFIAAEYPWFIETYDNYPYPIQRADTIRYFILAHFGGTYIDLDNVCAAPLPPKTALVFCSGPVLTTWKGCARRLDPLNSYPAWLHRTLPTGISNDAMASIPHHPFFLYVIESLSAYDRDWGLPYITVMYTTGPLFLSVLWKNYMSSGKNIGDGKDGGRVRILMNDDYHQKPWSFFNTFMGSSWHGDDARFIFWMGENWLLLTTVGVLVAGVVALASWWLWTRIVAMGHRKQYGMKPRWWKGGPRWNRKGDYELESNRYD